jgi:DNA-binding transcriptional MerR regulator
LEYTIQKLAQMAGVSSRTLRYYDEMGLLHPIRISSSGYRIYGENEVDRLQHILFYRELGLELEHIKTILNQPDFDHSTALESHREKLLERRAQLDRLIENVEKTLAYHEGRQIMSNKEKFESFKSNMVDDNEKKYGKEIREKYGEDTINKSNQKVLNMTEEELNAATQLAEDILHKLSDAMETGDPHSPTAQEVAEMHKRWLNFYWPSYSKEAHAGLAQMYVDDERFTAYYDNKIRTGAAIFLRDAIHIFTGQNIQ